LVGIDSVSEKEKKLGTSGEETRKSVVEPVLAVALNVTNGAN
jgi:hypothetical protein